MHAWEENLLQYFNLKGGAICKVNPYVWFYKKKQLLKRSFWQPIIRSEFGINIWEDKLNLEI